MFGTHEVCLSDTLMYVSAQSKILNEEATNSLISLACFIYQIKPDEFRNRMEYVWKMEV